MQTYDNAQPRRTSVSDEGNVKDELRRDEPQASTSVETIRHLPLHLTLSTRESRTSRPGTPSQPSSPHSSLPSPSSPSGDSVSSFPSVSSSFLFSSGPGSPPHLAHHTNDGSEHEQGDSSLIIPSLTLPVSLRRPTPYGRGLGEIRLLVLGREDTEVASLFGTLADEEYEEIVDISSWEDMMVEGITDLAKPPARILRVSTDWVEYRDAHGLEKHEPSRNVELVHLPEYTIDDDPAEIMRNALTIIRSPFHSLMSVVHPEQAPNDLLAALLSSSTSPLYTAMVLMSPPSSTTFEHTLITELSAHIPLIILPPLPHTLRQSRSIPVHDPGHLGLGHPLSNAPLSTVTPESATALRNALYRRPESLATLRVEAADRFLRWREVERAVGSLLCSPEARATRSASSQRTPRAHAKLEQSPIVNLRRNGRWDKTRWEAEWEGALSTDVAKTLRTRRGISTRTTITDYFDREESSMTSTATHNERSMPHDLCSSSCHRTAHVPGDGVPSPSLDPLHIPSLLAFSISLLAPLKARLGRVFRFHSSPVNDAMSSSGKVPSDVDTNMRRWVLAGVFCAGVGIGLVLARM